MIGFKDTKMNILLLRMVSVNFKRPEEEHTCFLLPVSAKTL